MAFIYRVTLVFFVLSFTALSQSKTTDAQFDGLKGKVKSVRTYDSDIETKNGKQVRTERRLVFSDEYDSYGRQRSNSNYVIGIRIGIRNNFAVIDGDKTSIWEHFAVPGPSGFSQTGHKSSPPGDRIRPTSAAHRTGNYTIPGAAGSFRRWCGFRQCLQRRGANETITPGKEPSCDEERRTRFSFSREFGTQELKNGSKTKMKILTVLLR